MTQGYFDAEEPARLLYDTSDAALTDAGTLYPGFYWVLAPTKEFAAWQARNLKIPAHERAVFVRSSRTAEHGETFAVVQVVRTVGRLPFERRAQYIGENVTDEQLRSVDPRALGVWEQDSPSWIHTASEMAEEIQGSAERAARAAADAAERAAGAVSSGVKTAAWVGGGALVLFGLFYFGRR